MQSIVMLALGGYRFSVLTGGYQKLERYSKWRWPAQERIGAPLALQYVGPGEDTLSIEGTIFTHYRGGLGQVDQMRSQAGRGTPLPLTSGSGRFFGMFAILGIREGQSVLMSDGAPRKIEFTVELQAYS